MRAADVRVERLLTAADRMARPELTAARHTALQPLAADRKLVRPAVRIAARLQAALPLVAAARVAQLRAAQLAVLRPAHLGIRRRLVVRNLNRITCMPSWWKSERRGPRPTHAAIPRSHTTSRARFSRPKPRRRAKRKRSIANTLRGRRMRTTHERARQCSEEAPLRRAKAKLRCSQQQRARVCLK